MKTESQQATQAAHQSPYVGWRLKGPEDPRPLWRHMHIERIRFPDEFRYEQQQYAAMLRVIAERLEAMNRPMQQSEVANWLRREAGVAEGV